MYLTEYGSIFSEYKLLWWKEGTAIHLLPGRPRYCKGAPVGVLEMFAFFLVGHSGGVIIRSALVSET